MAGQFCPPPLEKAKRFQGVVRSVVTNSKVVMMRSNLGLCGRLQNSSVTQVERRLVKSAYVWGSHNKLVMGLPSIWLWRLRAIADIFLRCSQRCSSGSLHWVLFCIASTFAFCLCFALLCFCYAHPTPTDPTPPHPTPHYPHPTTHPTPQCNTHRTIKPTHTPKPPPTPAQPTPTPPPTPHHYLQATSDPPNPPPTPADPTHTTH